ncbi:uncharacterized protein KY384_007778 [Bacidia gigantensis]|uniref:uncharacterized protein n=1 Tax=Bacidia gigantensis TaxID=2732470 RepID=UPI001D039659|nr:uncharacterized protein KY384_007778 [Bacidia gigantensis]KAG8527625.1 hypothetical protein KY384_007778 [Bacidia gigantensis]
MENLVRSGKVRFIGISNFDAYQVSTLQINATIKPAVHQFELHPYLQQSDYVDWHQALGISVTAYSPLASANPTYGHRLGGPPSLFDNEEITTIAERRGCTNAQVALAWGMARETSVIPKSQHAERIVENWESRRCNLQKVDLQLIAAVGKKYLTRFNNPSKGWDVPLYEGLDDSRI